MELQKRKTIRLKDYDYSSPGAYFITICTHNRECLLSNIIVGEGLCALPQNILTPIGNEIKKSIQYINDNYIGVKIEKYVIMPNHIHIMFQIENDGRGNPSPTIPNVVGWLKYNITKQINKVNNKPETKVFQRSFHDHIIRSKADYLKIWNYIDTNPQKWNDDCFYVK